MTPATKDDIVQQARARWWRNFPTRVQAMGRILAAAPEDILVTPSGEGDETKEDVVEGSIVADIDEVAQLRATVAKLKKTISRMAPVVTTACDWIDDESNAADEALQKAIYTFLDNEGR